MRDVVHVQAAGGEVAGDEDVDLLFAERVHHLGPLGLVQVAVDLADVEVFGLEVLRDLADGGFGFAEDHGRVGLVHRQQFEQKSTLVPWLDGQVLLIDHRHGQRAGDGGDLFAVGLHERAGEALDLHVHRRGDEDGLSAAFGNGLVDRPGDGFEDAADVFAEADVEHAVDFVEDDVADLVE